MPDQDSYPTEIELTVCQAQQDFDVLMQYVAYIWTYPECVSDANYRWKLSTGGWSGNEDIIDALKQNTMFWLFCWVQSRRGGHYIFQTPSQQKAERDDKDA